MKKPLFLITISLFIYLVSDAQVVISDDSISTTDSSALLELRSREKGFLLTRLNTFEQRNIINPATGLLVFNLDSLDIYIFNGTIWHGLIDTGDTITPWQCGDNIDYDGQSYATVLIGTQCWMAENLNVGTMINGSLGQINNDTIEKYCYNDNPSFCNTYGGLYQWDEMMLYTTSSGARGICPSGWHVPTDAEWCTLENEVDTGTISCTATGWRGTVAGSNLKEMGTSHWYSPNLGATNSSGFTALPGGLRYDESLFASIYDAAYFWTSDSYGAYAAWIRFLDSLHTGVRRINNNNIRGQSVRCLKDI